MPLVSNLVSKDVFLSKLKELPTLDVDVPELGGSVRVRTLSGAERDAWEAANFQDGKLTLANVRARLVAVCLVDEQGNRWFSELDAQRLGDGSAAVLDRIYQAARKLNGIGARDEEELLKNSNAAPSGGDGSGSPA